MTRAGSLQAAGGTASPELQPCRGELAALLVVGVAFAAAVWAIISVPAPLGHDESVYALQGRAMLAGSPPSAMSAIGEHRAPLLGALGAVVQLATVSERALRVVSLCFGLAALGAGWSLVRTSSAAGGVLAAAGIAAVPAVQRGAAFFLTDLPAAALVLVAAAILWQQMERRTAPTYLLPAAAVALAAAFYLRYGSTLPIGLLVLTALALWWRHWLRHVRLGLLAAGAGMALAVPHVLNAQRTFGTPWGRVLDTVRDAANYADVRDRDVGFSAYLEQFPTAVPGHVVTVSLAVTTLFVVVCLVRVGRRRGLLEHHRLGVLLGVPGVVHIVAMAATTHVEDRFLLPGMVLTTAAAAVALSSSATWLGARAPWLPQRALRVGTAGVATVGLVALLTGAAWQELATRERFGETNKPVALLASEVGTMAAGAGCTVVTGYQPQVAWYSGCGTVGFGSDPAALVDMLHGRGAFLTFFDAGKRQPEGAEKGSYLAFTDGQPVARVAGTTDSRLEPAEAYWFPASR